MNENEPNTLFDKNTLVAIVLSVVVMAGGTWVQQKFFPQKPLPESEKTAVSTVEALPPEGALESTASSVKDRGTPSAALAAPMSAEFEAPSAETTYTIKTDTMEAVFTNRGGDLISLRLPKHADREGVVELIDADKGEAEAFSLILGGADEKPLRELMNYRRIDDNTIEFWRTFLPTNGDTTPFTLRKRFTLVPGEYMFRLEVIFEDSANEPIPLNQDGYAYTLTYGPRIGPVIQTKGRYSDFRKLMSLENGKRRNINPKNGREVSPNRAAWSAVAGKYFALVVIPDATSYTTTYQSRTEDGAPVLTSLSLSRPVIKSSRQTDIFHIYFGPKTSKELSRYDDASKNAFGRSGDRLEEVLEGNNILGWLESIMKFFLNLFYGLIPNYGIAIILLTLLVKAVMFPITIKGAKGTARMQELQPKMVEIQNKYKNNPEKMNQEMAEFYKREGYNPMSGCLPMLIQFPIFIAMYNLFNNHFDLRGANFIAGWISDLSQPEAIYTFAQPINLVFWKLSAIRGLPIIYVLSQLFYGKFTQQPQSGGGQNAAQMKLMMYGMPIMFFFILYDVPSGLLVYWIISNLVSIVQQIITNQIIHNKKTNEPVPVPAAGHAAPRSVKKKKKGKRK